MKQKKLEYIELLKLFGILSIVLGHSMIIYDAAWGAYTPFYSSKVFFILKQFINTYQLTIFVFASGYLFNVSKSKKNLTLSDIVKSKFNRLIVPYILVGMLYMIPIRLLIGYRPYRGLSYFRIVWENIIFVRDVSQLWFLPMLFSLFIIFYIADKYFLRKTNVLVNIVLLICLSIVSIKVPSIFVINLTLYYFLFFYLGYSEKENRKLSLKKKYIYILILVSSVIFVINLSLILSAKASMFISLARAVIQLLLGILLTIVLYSGSILITDKIDLSRNKVYRMLSKHSFNIYLFHSPIIYVIYSRIGGRPISPVLLVAICFVTSIMVSILLSFVINYLKKVFKTRGSR